MNLTASIINLVDISIAIDDHRMAAIARATSTGDILEAVGCQLDIPEDIAIRIRADLIQSLPYGPIL